MMETDHLPGCSTPGPEPVRGPQIHPRETPLAALLAQAAAPPLLQVYCGVLDASGVGRAGARETRRFLAGAAVHDLGWLRRVAVRGEDRLRWLNGMVTNTVSGLGENSGAWNFVLNAQGRIQGDLHVWREGDALSLEIAADQYEKLLAHLDRFIIMDDVELVPRSLDAEGRLTGETALGLSGPLAADLLKRLGLPALPEALTSARALWNGPECARGAGLRHAAPHYELWTRAAEIPALWQALAEAGATPVGADSIEAFRIAEGIPAYGIDIAERDLPQETSQTRALCFTKGCYVGQEIVERIHSRGSVRRHLRPLELFGPVPAAGAALAAEDGAEAGRITSAAELLLSSGKRIFALGMMREENGARNQTFTYTAGTAAGKARTLATPPKLGSKFAERIGKLKNMSDKPKFEVIDRRKIKAEEEQENQQASTPKAEEKAPAASAEPKPGPRLVVNESQPEAPEAEGKLPPAPTAQESTAQKAAYDASAERLEDMVRAQNPAAGAPPPITFESLVQQFYVSALIQMGAGAPEGQQPRVDIHGRARHHRPVGRAGGEDPRQPDHG
jgi:folate-binding protein YgfZ